jgi:hypothetical protein
MAKTCRMVACSALRRASALAVMLAALVDAPLHLQFLW